jgi:DNA repair exonuclease SbcCD ATPase subunit
MQERLAQRKMIELESIHGKDFMPFVGEFSVPLAKQGVTFVVGENRVSRMAGSNGAGKTALFDAITIAAYDRLLKGSSGARLINNDADKMWLALYFTVNKKPYVVEREQSGSKRRWELYEHDGKKYELVGSGEKVATYFGLSYRAFVQTILYGVSEEKKFAGMSDAPRKQIFDDLLDLAFFGDRRKAVEIEARQFGDALSDLKHKLDLVNSQLEAIQGERDNLEQSREQAEIEAMRQWLDRHRERLDLYDEINTLYVQLEVTKVSSERHQVLVDDSTTLSALRNKMDQVAKTIVRRIEGIQGDHDSIINAGRCAMCRRTIGKVERIEVDQHFETLIRPLYDEVQRLVIYNSALTHVLHTWPTSRADDDYALVHAKLQRTLRETQDLERHVSQLDEARFMRQAADEMLERIEVLQRDREKYERDITALTAEVDLRDFWVEGFGHKGMKAMMLRDYEGFIQGKLLSYSQSLTAGELIPRFSAQRILKNGDVREEITFEVENKYGAKVYDDLSSGEKQRVDLCLVLALQDLTRELHHGRFSLALYDEIFEHLDETGCERVMDFLSTQRKDFSSIFCISQNPKLLAYPSDHIIRVIKTAKGSSIHVE